MESMRVQPVEKLVFNMTDGEAIVAGVRLILFFSMLQNEIFSWRLS